MRVFYIDDSGNEDVAVVAAVTFELERWPVVLKQWLGWRKWLFRQYQLPVDYELHAQEFISGHGKIPPLADPPAIDRTLGLRKRAYQQSLQQLNRQEGVHVTALARKGLTVKAAYAEFVQNINQWLINQDEQGICIVDGQDDSSYRPAHRELELKTRALLEDPGMQSSAHSQLIQAADLVSYAAFQSLDGAKPFMADWYDRTLASSFLNDSGLPALDSDLKA